MSQIILFSILGVVGLLVIPAIAEYVHRFIENDGYGARTSPPRSHESDTFDPRSRLLPRY